MQYRPEIDGLRALAVVPVIFFHAGLEIFSGGFVGVDIFFVISGYLITTILLAELTAGKFSLLNFYERRARRIAPAFFLVMFACLPFAWLWLLPKALQSFAETSAAVSVFSSNIYFWRTSNYFSTAAEYMPLLHTWSLAVEEQYYLFFPVFLMAIWRWGRPAILAVLIIVALASLALAEFRTSVSQAFVFFMLPSRAWELLIGALVAMHLFHDKREPGRFIAEAGSLMGLLLLAGSLFAFDKNTRFPGVYALAPTVGTALIILFASGTTGVGRLLGHRVLVGIGLISYSAYLWHQPLLAFARHRAVEVPSESLMLAMGFLSLALAYLSWKYVETPFRNKTRFSRRFVFAATTVCSVFFICFGILAHHQKGFPDRIPASTEMPGAQLAGIQNGWCFYSIDTIASLASGQPGVGCLLGQKTATAKALLFGDSFAGQYEPLWGKVGEDLGLAINAVTTNWCFPSMRDGFTGPTSSRAFEQCLFNRKYVVENLEKYDLVILGGDWGNIMNQKKLDQVVEFIAYAAPKVSKIVVMASPKRFDLNVMDSFKKSKWFDESFDISRIPANGDAFQVKANSELLSASGKFSNVIFVGRDSLFTRGGAPSDMTSGGIPFSLEGQHISIEGAHAAAENFQRSAAYRQLRAMSPP